MEFVRDSVVLGETVNDMMAGTHSLRRKEVVGESPGVADFKERGPALFEPFQINEEIRRCTTVPLESTFMSQLDRYTPKLLELFLVSDYHGIAVSSVHEKLKMQSIRIYTEPDAVGIIIKGIPVVTHLDNVTRACCLLLGVTFALNLKYPSTLTYTFEVF